MQSLMTLIKMEGNVRKNRDIIAKIDKLYEKVVYLKSRKDLLFKILTILCFYLNKRTHDEHRPRVTRFRR